MEVGLSGFKRAEYRKGSKICPRKSLINRFNPLQPASTRIDFLNKEAKK